jgi:hypothetical protein
MNKLNHIWSAPVNSIMLAVVIILAVQGCSSIGSKAVKNLIDIETEKIEAAMKNAEDFTNATDQAIENWKESVAALNDSLENQRKVESVHTLVFSANRNIETKVGVDAHAAAYLIGNIYLADRMGLEQAVRDQFEEDFETLKALAEQISDSWTALHSTQKQIDAFAEKSSIASIDPEVVRALIVAFKADTEGIDKVLKRSKQVNDALKKASGLGIIEGFDTGRAKTAVEDVINLLEQVKETDG